jgi:glycosyltransferase involved in cell wall biosynthesis
MAAAAEVPTPIGVPMLTYVPMGMGGTETYAKEVLHRLEADQGFALTSFLAPAAVGTLGKIGREVTVSGVNGGASTVERLRSLYAAVLPWRRKLVRGFDAVFYPFTVPVPIPKGSPFAMTLHDVQHLDMPEFFSPAERMLRRFTYDLAARRADLVITVSEFCRSRIVARLGVPEERVVVAPLGVSAAFRPDKAPRENFVLYPARRWPHKNHARLLTAMEQVRRSHPDLRLVLTGGGADLPDAPDWVEQRGFVSEVELARLYRRARCMAFPSLYEGFGMPPLEAMASGCPTAVSTAGSLGEVCGDATVAFDPMDPEAIARAILGVLEDDGTLARRGVEHAATYTWDRCAQIHARAIRSLAASRR